MPATFTLDLEVDAPDLQRLLAKLDGARLAGALKNIGEAGVPLARDAFQQSRDPYGDEWPALQESTLAALVGKAGIPGRKRRSTYGTKPLVRTSKLVNSLNWQLVGSDAVSIGASVAYGKYHQGDPDHPSKGIVPRRMFLPTAEKGLPDAWREELTDAVESYLAVGGEA